MRDAWFLAGCTYNTYEESNRYFAARFDEVTYAHPDESYDGFRPAYRYGARAHFSDRGWDDEIEQQLRNGWQRARDGVQDAYASPYIDYNSRYDDKPDYNKLDYSKNASPGAGGGRVADDACIDTTARAPRPRGMTQRGNAVGWARLGSPDRPT